MRTNLIGFGAHQIHGTWEFLTPLNAYRIAFFSLEMSAIALRLKIPETSELEHVSLSTGACFTIDFGI